MLLIAGPGYAHGDIAGGAAWWRPTARPGTGGTESCWTTRVMTLQPGRQWLRNVFNEATLDW
jgi:hypothetical protein